MGENERILPESFLGDCGPKLAGENIRSLDCSFKQYTNELYIVLFLGTAGLD